MAVNCCRNANIDIKLLGEQDNGTFISKERALLI
jgi:hypothetical protein